MKLYESESGRTLLVEFDAEHDAYRFACDAPGERSVSVPVHASAISTLIEDLVLYVTQHPGGKR